MLAPNINISSPIINKMMRFNHEIECFPACVTIACIVCATLLGSAINAEFWRLVLTHLSGYSGDDRKGVRVSGAGDG